MATIKKVKKAQYGTQLDSTGKRFPKANVPASARTPTAPPPKKVSTSGIIMKSKKGGSFDLNKDGKTTFKDVLIGRGVLPKTAKKGMKVKKAQNGYDDKLRYPKDAKKSYEESGNPKINLVNSGSRSVDTTGFAAGRTIFPTKSTKPVPGTGYGKAKRKDVEKSISVSKGKTGAKMIMKRAQAGATLPKAEIPMKKTKPSSNVSKIKVAMKKGGKMTKTCKYGCK